MRIALDEAGAARYVEGEINKYATVHMKAAEEAAAVRLQKELLMEKDKEITEEIRREAEEESLAGLKAAEAEAEEAEEEEDEEEEEEEMEPKQKLIQILVAAALLGIAFLLDKKLELPMWGRLCTSCPMPRPASTC